MATQREQLRAMMSSMSIGGGGGGGGVARRSPSGPASPSITAAAAPAPARPSSAPSVAPARRRTAGRGGDCSEQLQAVRRVFSVLLVLDSSGSMQHRWRDVVRGVQPILAELDESDQFGCMVFNDGVERLRPLGKGDDAAKDALIKQLKAVRCGGATALYEAVLAGIDESQSSIARMAAGGTARRPGAAAGGGMRLDADDDDEDDAAAGAAAVAPPRHTHYLFVMTDGENNEGSVQLSTAQAALRSLSSSRMARECEVKCVFVGIDVTPTMVKQMQQLAQAGGACSAFHTVGLHSSSGHASVADMFKHELLVPILKCKVFDPDPLWALISLLHASMLNEALADGLSLSRPSDLPGFYAVLTQYERHIAAAASHAQWMGWKRRQWHLFMHDRDSYSNAHWASCLYAVEAHVLPGAQKPDWFRSGARDLWMALLLDMGAAQLPFVDPAKVGRSESEVLAALAKMLADRDGKPHATAAATRAGDRDPRRTAAGLARLGPAAVYPGPFASIVPGHRVRMVTRGVDDYNRALKEAGVRLIVVEYQARSWCGPCRAFHPVFEQLSKDYPGVAFISVPDRATCPANEQLDAVVAVAFYPCYRIFVGDTKPPRQIGGTIKHAEVEAHIKKYRSAEYASL